MREEPFNLIYKKAKKIRTILLLYTEKNIKRKENISRINNLYDQNIFQKGSMKVSFEEFYCENNVEIFTENLNKKDKKVFPNLSKTSSYCSSEKSLCIYKDISTISTDESFTKKEIGNEKKINNDITFFNKKSKTKNEKGFLFENNKNVFPINYDNVNKKNNKTFKSFNDNLIDNYKRNNTFGKRYLRNLSKYLGVIRHKKKKINQKSFNKKYTKKYKNRKDD